jgi:S-adenosylmethionine:tRNA-ribosyltransferase-isomerase (queuine synthetase)
MLPTCVFTVFSAYAAALSGRYLWHEFGDVHLIID